LCATPVAPNVLAFVDMMMTPARVFQGMQELFGDGPYEKRGVGDLIKWSLNDVQSEGQDELEASSLAWKDVVPHLVKSIREIYFAEVEKI